MSDWELLKTEEAQQIWDKNLTRFAEYSPFQMYAWGEHNSAMGWEPLYLVARNKSGEICAMMLGLLRRYPLGFGLIWCEGGPAGDITLWNDDLQKAITRETGIKRLYCRIRCDRERNISDALALNYQGWMRSWVIMHSAWTMALDLNQSEEQLLKNCSGNWRRNLKTAKKENVKVRLWKNPEPDEIHKVFVEMQKLKNLPELFSRDQLENLFKHAGENLICFRGEDEDGNVIAIRACLNVGERACEFMGATTQRGRDFRISYLIVWNLVLECRRRGIKFYDLCGIDPFENPGGYRYKKQTGAKPLEALGEWDRASSEWLRWLGNWAIWRKNRIKKVKTVVKKLTTRKQVKLTEELANQ